MTGSKFCHQHPNRRASNKHLRHNKHCVLFEWQNHSTHRSIGLDCLISTCALISLLFWCNNEREANRFQSVIAFSNDEIPEATKGSLTLISVVICTRRDDENPWMNYIMTTHLSTRGYYATFIQFQLVCNCLQYTITHNIVRRPLNKVNLFFGNWNLFLIDSVGCFFIIVIRLCSTISGATECDTVQHFHWLSFECRDCFTHCSISIFFIVILTVFSLSLLSHLFYYTFTIGWHSNAGV